MSFVNPDFVERYQMLYEKDPNSKIFAPLGEAYRRMGLLDAAYEVCRKGVEHHPHFPSGRVALAKVLIDRGSFNEAVNQLIQATELSPENLLAHGLLADTWLKLRCPKEALQSFKMVLFLNPRDEKAREAVQKLESLTADEYDSELFAPTSLAKVKEGSAKGAGRGALVERMRALERHLSLADAFIVRNEIEKALETLARAQSELGEHPEIQSRLNFLTQREPDEAPPPPLLDRNPRLNRQRQMLEKLLQRINERRAV